MLLVINNVYFFILIFAIFMNYQQLSREFKNVASPFLTTLAEYTFAGAVVGCIISKELPYGRVFIFACGMFFTLFLFTLSIIIRSINTNHD